MGESDSPGSSRQREYCYARFVTALAGKRHPEGIRDAVAELFQEGSYQGMEDREIREIVQFVAQTNPARRDDLLRVLASLTPGETAISAPPPALRVGQAVRVEAGNRSNTPREGVVTERVWHHKDRKWMYFIRPAGKKISKRYFLEELTPL